MCNTDLELPVIILATADQRWRLADMNCTVHWSVISVEGSHVFDEMKWRHLELETILKQTPTEIIQLFI